MFSSRRIICQAESQLSGKGVTRQARPRTVNEVMISHETAADSSQPLSKRVMIADCVMSMSQF